MKRRMIKRMKRKTQLIRKTLVRARTKVNQLTNNTVYIHRVEIVLNHIIVIPQLDKRLNHKKITTCSPSMGMEKAEC